MSVVSGCGAAVAAAMMALCVALPEARAGGTENPPLLLFAGTDLWRDGHFLYGGLLWSPGGVDRDGFTGIR